MAPSSTPNHPHNAVTAVHTCLSIPLHVHIAMHCKLCLAHHRTRRIFRSLRGIWYRWTAIGLLDTTTSRYPPILPFYASVFASNQNYLVCFSGQYRLQHFSQIRWIYYRPPLQFPFPLHCHLSPSGSTPQCLAPEPHAHHSTRLTAPAQQPQHARHPSHLLSPSHA